MFEYICGYTCKSEINPWVHSDIFLFFFIKKEKYWLWPTKLVLCPTVWKFLEWNSWSEFLGYIPGVELLSDGRKWNFSRFCYMLVYICSQQSSVMMVYILCLGDLWKCEDIGCQQWFSILLAFSGRVQKG